MRRPGSRGADRGASGPPSVLGLDPEQAAEGRARDLVAPGAHAGGPVLVDAPVHHADEHRGRLRDGRDPDGEPQQDALRGAGEPLVGRDLVAHPFESARARDAARFPPAVPRELAGGTLHQRRERAVHGDDTGRSIQERAGLGPSIEQSDGDAQYSRTACRRYSASFCQVEDALARRRELGHLLTPRAARPREVPGARAPRAGIGGWTGPGWSPDLLSFLGTAGERLRITSRITSRPHPSPRAWPSGHPDRLHAEQRRGLA